MTQKWTTLTEFILKEEQNIPSSTGAFTMLLNQIGEATKIIASHVKNSGLVDIEGATGGKNTYQEEVQKLDELSNNVLINILKESGQVHTIISEEEEHPRSVTTRSGDYIVYLDPLDGSSNIDVNVSVGTIFSIYHKDKGDILQAGSKQVAAGYILYGTSVMFIYTTGGTVNGFTLDPSIGSFILSHPNIRIPDKKHVYSINEGYYQLYDEDIKEYLLDIKNPKDPYSHRYIGSMVADVHRTLLHGGIFLYPANSKNPEGKLRLMLEVNPLSYIIKHAGGSSVSRDFEDPLMIEPTEIHERVPVAMGSTLEVKKYLSFVTSS